ncbi:PD-(D/E)XK nuclease family protein, partial [Bacillus xiapuensis]|nr:PD-(D/E)XK nuclease family protein [Bacillus xiapuensis]
NKGLQTSDEIMLHPSAWAFSILSSKSLKSQEIDDDFEEDSNLDLVKNSELIPTELPFAREIFDRLKWEYSYRDAVANRSKQSVSEMKRQREISDEQSGTDLIQRFKKPILKRPKFMQEKQLSSAERGTALHMVMQHVDVTKPISVESIHVQVENMVVNELLTAEQAQVIDAQLIAQFFTTELGKRLCAAKEINREIPFTICLPAEEVYMNWKDETESIFVQGIIDCIFEDDQGLVLIDYKSDGITDRYKGGFEQAKPILLERYQLQINLYTKAIEQIWKRKVNERYLFFFDGAHILNLD